MDLRQYFRKLREIESSIDEDYPMVTSLETAEGGKAGTVSEVSRYMAAKLIVEGRATLASPEEKQSYREERAVRKAASERADLARRVRVTLLNDSDLQKQLGETKDRTEP